MSNRPVRARGLLPAPPARPQRQADLGRQVRRIGARVSVAPTGRNAGGPHYASYLSAADRQRIQSAPLPDQLDRMVWRDGAPLFDPREAARLRDAREEGRAAWLRQYNAMTPAQRADADRLIALRRKPEVRAALAAINAAEGHPSARQMFSNPGRPTYFNGYKKHPGQIGAFFRGDRQSAAGLYQITKQTNEDLERFGYTDFYPFTQELMALKLLDGKRGVGPAEQSDVPALAMAASQVWAGVPRGPLAGEQSDETHFSDTEKWGVQRPTRYDAFREAYERALERERVRERARMALQPQRAPLARD